MKLSQLLAASDYQVSQIQAMPDDERAPMLFAAMTITIHTLRDIAQGLPPHKRVHREAMRAAKTVQDLALFFVTEVDGPGPTGNELLDGQQTTPTGPAIQDRADTALSGLQGTNHVHPKSPELGPEPQYPPGVPELLAPEGS